MLVVEVVDLVGFILPFHFEELEVRALLPNRRRLDALRVRKSLSEEATAVDVIVDPGASHHLGENR
eukprot:CAMPEP_0195033552 /NCGR_PEP_ID=MMETSP0326_2-20130528/65831_1 /TAXON_ID=2866 ORGANISM="Crypthecodinium cohnii, Strain Seligo" /NCGR_SAMPLE_ID=MMETSP0326_2 /ASSEMBLY_ACC=CAM_ASM_000348 /LENGTH=65 /DNA_ID=CAMNT_0040058017 /DNA_START=671 /DNA_END=868 /DNA_ORIENTATION=-